MSIEAVARFYKISLANYNRDYEGTFQYDLRYKLSDREKTAVYESIILPNRATKYSAGYDFYSPIDFTMKPKETIKIPTGIRCKMNDDIVLMIYPRSSLGFKYSMWLNNTVGIIDSDYFNSDNEGHIFIKFTNLGDKEFSVKKGSAFAQGIFTKYYVTFDDDVNNIRNGGLGSTNAK